MEDGATSDFKWKVRHTLTVRRFTCHPNTISHKLGLQPRMIGIKGESVPRSKHRKYAVNIWSTKWYDGSGDTEWMNQREHVTSLEALVEYLLERHSIIRQLLVESEVYLTTSIRSDSFNIAYSLSPSLSEKLGRLGVDWCVDTYH